MHTFLQDLRFGFRSLVKDPGFTTIVILTLAIGIGATAAIFSFFDGVLLKPLPYPDPEQLVLVWEKPPGGDRNVISTMNFLDWKKQNSVFAHIAAITGSGQTLTGVSEPIRLRGARVSPSYFDVFGIRPVLGRNFSPEEDIPGRDRVVLLSNRVWVSRFGADRSIIGRKIGLNGEPHIVIGVLPPNSPVDRSFFEIWTPLAFRPDEMTRDFHWLRAFARLKPGVSIEAASQEMTSIGANIARDFPKSNKGWSVTIERMEDRFVNSQLRQSLYVLMSAVAAVLLIGCVNITNLLLARGTTREREVAIRSSLGAGRLRLVRQFLTESLTVSGLGAVLGLAVAFAMVKGLQVLMPPFSLPAEAEVGINGRVLLFTLAVAVLTAVVFGTAPALHASRVDLTGSLKEGARGASGGGRRQRLRGALVVAEVALAFVLVTGAGLLIRSFVALQSVDAGFDSTNVVSMGLPVASTRLPDPEALLNYQAQVVAQVRSLPGVRDVALTSALPLQGWGYGMPYQLAHKPRVDTANRKACFFKMVSPSYASALKIRLRKGRFLSELDRRGGAPVTVINEIMAKRDFADQDPIGKRILVEEIVPGRPQLGREIPWEVVGVIADEKVGGLDDNRSAGMYVPLEQSPNYNTSLLVSGSTDPAQLTKGISTQIHAIEKDQALTDIRTLEQIKNESVAGTRLRTMLLGVFASIALLLAAVGIYGVMSYSVAQRTHELGIRAALGAHEWELVRLVVRAGMTLAGVGLLIGAAGSFLVSRTLTSLLFSVQPGDPATFSFVAALLILIAGLACYLPARRITQADPVQALRYD